MGRFNKKIIFILVLLGILLLNGCDKFQFNTYNASDDKGTGTDITLAPTNDVGEETKDFTTKSATSTQKTTNQEEDATPTPSVMQPSANVDLQVYTVNVDTGNIDTTTALLTQDTEITPALIVNTVVESMADQSIDVGIDEITTKGDAVIVSFTKNNAPVIEYEAAILDAIAQSLIDNLKEYSKVIYRIEGKAYVSDHYELGINEAWDN